MALGKETKLFFFTRQNHRRTAVGAETALSEPRRAPGPASEPLRRLDGRPGAGEEAAAQSGGRRRMVRGGVEGVPWRRVRRLPGPLEGRQSAHLCHQEILLCVSGRLHR